METGRPGKRRPAGKAGYETMVKPLIFTNARIIDPSRQCDEYGSLIVIEGKIAAAGAQAHNQGRPEGAKHYDLGGRVVIPGLVDGRAFIGTADSLPGETVKTTGAAAAAGGVAALVAVAEKGGAPADTVTAIRALCAAGQNGSLVPIYPVAALTKGMEGCELTEFGLLRAAGAIALAEGHETLRNSAILRRAFQYARDYDLPVMLETQEADLSAGAVMTEGWQASFMGLPAAPRAAEAIALQRDMELARLTGVRYHAAHISTAPAVEIIRQAKAEGLAVSAATSINSLSFNETAIGAYDSAWRFFPPLRAEEDRQALIAAIADGVIDAVTSCHEPRSADAKARPFAAAAAGAVGLESLLPAALRLYHSGHISLLRLIEVLSTRPAQIFGLPGGTLQPGAAADFAILDLEETWLFAKDKLASACNNTAFDKMPFQGRLIAGFINGKAVYERNLSNLSVL
ncbi:dihydroorotase [Candidatus Tokpelaia sp.]|nr:dihydroorotase [Candidatus Tokpelaia sp.]